MEISLYLIFEEGIEDPFSSKDLQRVALGRQRKSRILAPATHLSNKVLLFLLSSAYSFLET